MLASAAAGALAYQLPALAAWPERPIRIVAHFAPGGSNDLLARVLAAELPALIGQPLLVENKPGANGNVGVAAAARATPDGYTFLVASGSALVNPSLGKVPYDLEKDFVPVAYLGGSPNVLVTSRSSGITSFKDLVEKSKARPDKFTIGSPGKGSTPELASELLKLRAGFKAVAVPFNGLAPAVQATLGGQTDMAVVTLAGVLGQIEAGQLLALVQTGAEPWPSLRNVPTVAQVGVPDAASETCQVLLAPTGTPSAALDRMTAAVLEVLRKPEVVAILEKTGFRVAPAGQDMLRKRLGEEIAMWADVVKRAGYKKDD
jgi:tripartite-type tricarboxylate transporter receptor subunit TctC